MEMPKESSLSSPLLGPGNRSVPSCVTPVTVLQRQYPKEESLSPPSTVQSEPNLGKYLPCHLHLDCQLHTLAEFMSEVDPPVNKKLVGNTSRLCLALLL